MFTVCTPVFKKIVLQLFDYFLKWSTKNVKKGVQN